ncbi:MAG: PrsW family intramembrane metalloprotease, partial [Bacteroidetes bacterium]|nr:PrsW family intramembrane metalloprotease [Bacteroidota bacterium]
KEPKPMLLKAFFGGVLSIFIALLFAIPLSEFESSVPSGMARSFYTSFFCAGIPEEFGKWIIFYWLIKKAKDFDQYYDGILYAIFISMGFALVENVLYVMKGGMGVAIIRAILAVPGHMLFAVPMGYYLSISKFEPANEAKKHIALSLIIPMLLHGTYDFLLFYMEAKTKINSAIVFPLFILFIAFEIYIWRIGLKKIKNHINSDKPS